MDKISKISNIKLHSPENGKDFGLDCYFKQDRKKKPILIFLHGFKGFKDWGHFPSIAEYFASQGFVFIAFNFSLNGTSFSQPHEFVDLAAFGINNFSRELKDLNIVIDFVESQNKDLPTNEMDFDQIYLFGFSRGGAIAILQAAVDQRIKKLVTWSSVSDMLFRWNQSQIDRWRKDGVIHEENSRTGQKMPLYFQFYEDLQGNENLNILRLAGKVQVPFLIVHAENDETIPLKMAFELHASNPKSRLEIISETGHTFGGFHPYTAINLPSKTLEACEKTLLFLN